MTEFLVAGSSSLWMMKILSYETSVASVCSESEGERGQGRFCAGGRTCSGL